MNVTTTTNQAECQMVLKTLEIAEVFRPTPPSPVCDGFLQLAPDCFLCGTNDCGRFTLHILEDTTKAEAWQFFETMRGIATKYINPRISFCGPSTEPAINN